MTLYRFDHCEIRPSERRLLVDGHPTPLGARAFDLLLALIERRDRTVTKNELLDLVWPGLVVEENNLQVQISTLRKLIGPQAIATIPGRGYRFALPLEAGEPAVPASTEFAGLERMAAGSPPTNLPERLPQLYGREGDISEVVRLLGLNRLVSIVGAGGIGKTRLGQAVAHRMRAGFTDGVWVIELAAISDGARVAATVAQTFNMGDSNDPLGAAIRAVRGKSAMLLLDNCEHLLDSVSALVAAIRSAAPDVTVLTTSQEPLKIPDEHVYRLGTLEVPAPATRASFDAREACGAVALFVARVEAADPHFTLNARNVGAVIDICRQLDGIALALELAAARVPLLGVDGLRARLHERFKLLTGGTRIALPRHQTLRAALEWSHALLSDAERSLFRRLGVFVGGFSLEAAQQVASDARMDKYDVLDHLGALIDKSLVLAAGDDTGANPRYSLLESTRLFALERLSEAGETDRLMERHCAAFSAWAEEAESHQADQPVRNWLLACEPERENLLQALHWAWSKSRRESFGSLFVAASLVGLASGDRVTVRPYVESALKCADSVSPGLASRMLRAAGIDLSLVSNQRAAAAYRRAIHAARSAGDRWLLYRALVSFARLMTSGLSLGANEEIEQAIAEARALEDRSWSVRIRANLRHAEGGACAGMGEARTARARFSEAISLYEHAQDAAGVLAVKIALMDLEVREGNTVEAIRLGESLLPGLRANRGNAHFPLAMLCGLYAREGDFERARSCASEALLAVRHGQLAATLFAPLALLIAREGRPLDAAKLLGYAEASLRTSSHNFERFEAIFRDEAVRSIDETVGSIVRTESMAEGEFLTPVQADALAVAPTWISSQD